MDFSQTFWGSFFSKNLNIFTYLYCSLGMIYFLKQKVLLPIFLILCFICQSIVYNTLHWHDAQANFYLLSSVTLFYFKPKLFQNFPIRKLVFLFLSIQFFGAGISKFKDSGLLWTDGHHLQFWLVYYKVLFDTPVGWKLIGNIEVCRFFSLSALVFQLTFPLCLFFSRLEKITLIFTGIFIILVYLFFNIHLLYLAPSLLVFLPWGSILNLKKRQDDV
ncbi:MAG: hypothetical protein NXH75_15845 [Halobacteriovoraceae bacterium]|nr:hypothetical protein [Halobacteriovoraceae bacterium]